MGVAVIATFAIPAGARAATVSGGGTINFTAAAGEINALVLSRSGTNYVITDAPGITITPSAPCASSAANVVTCPAAGVINGFQASLGNMNDSASVDDSVTSDLRSVAIFAGDGNDTLNGAKNVPNQLNGDDFAGTGADVITGGDLPDRLIDEGGADIVTGGLGDDRADGGGGVDVYVLGPGNDTYASSAVDGADSFSGGPGFDSIDFRSRTDDLSISLNDVADDGAACPGAGCEGDNIASDVENLSTGDGDDSLVGSTAENSFQPGPGNDTVDGGPGNDSLSDFAGDDSLQGGEGNDQIFSGDGTDTIGGGAGDDVLFADFTDEADVYAGGPGLDRLDTGGGEEGTRMPMAIDLDGVADDGFIDPGVGGAKDNVQADVESIEGGNGDDVLIGNGSANEIQGFGGDDTIAGGEGADQLSGGRGNDTIDGGTEVDTLDGGAGTDTLRSRDDSADQVDCGSSLDTVLADLLDEPEPSCETVSDGVVIGKSAKVAKNGKSAKLKVSCPTLEGIDCEVKVKLKAKGKKVASGKGTVPSGGSKQVKLKLTGKGAKALEDGKLKTEATVTFTDAAGAQLTNVGKVKVG